MNLNLKKNIILNLIFVSFVFSGIIHAETLGRAELPPIDFTFYNNGLLKTVSKSETDLFYGNNSHLNIAQTKNSLRFDLTSSNTDSSMNKKNSNAESIPNNQMEVINPVTNIAWGHKPIISSYYDEPFSVAIFNEKNGEDSARLWSQTKTIFGVGLAVGGVIAILPQGISKWGESDDQRSLDDKWWENIKAGPLWDRDIASVNYVGHTYIGGVYYQLARKSGYRQWDSFVYTTLMSTFYWEYGVEAFAEIPSIQDLVVTPVAGWVAGEYMFQKEKEIRRRGGKVFGSETWGDITLFFLDPIDSIGRGVNSMFGSNIVKAGTGYISFNDRMTPDGTFIEEAVQVNVSYQFDANNNKGISSKNHYYDDSVVDPIDHGIVGLSVGTGYANYSPEWQIENTSFWSASLGLYFTPRFSATLSYARSTPEEFDDSEPLTWENYNINGQYYFNIEQDLRPFITFGVGEVIKDEDNNRKIFQTHVGAGIYYKISDKIAWQTDWRYWYTNRLSRGDNTINSAIIYRFGKGEHSS